MNLHLVLACLLVSAIAYLMVYAGTGKRALEWKRRGRICPSCGRAAHDCNCDR
jgi:NADH pyrophosphatase NudC (nudix superfamily)